MRRSAVRARAHPIRMGLLTAGTMAGFGTLGATSYGAYKFTQSTTRAAEADQMARMILTAQAGPFGPSGKLLGMGANTNNSAGLALAAHYAGNRNKRFGLLGLKYL